MDENTTENMSLRMKDTTTRGKSQRTDDLSCLAAASALAGRQQVVRHRTMRQLHYDVHRRPVERDAVEVNNVRVAQLGENSALVAKFGRGIFVFGRHHQALSVGAQAGLWRRFQAGGCWLLAGGNLAFAHQQARFPGSQAGPRSVSRAPGLGPIRLPGRITGQLRWAL